MNDILIPDKFSLDGIEPNMIEVKKLGKALLTIHADGRITVSEDLKPTETAAEVLRIMRDQWLADVQCAKIREQEERIKRLEEAGDKLSDCADQIGWTSCESPQWIKKAENAVKEWNKAKEAKP